MIQAERKLQVIDGALPNEPLLQVAFASADQLTVDQHFGSCRSFMIYGLAETSASLTQVVQFKQLEAGHDTGKLEARYEALQGCSAVYCMACGPAVINQLRGMGIQALKIAEGTPIHELISELQQQLRQGPTGWLKRAYQAAQPESSQPDRLASMLDEEW